MTNAEENAKRYQFIRDVMLRGEKRSNLMQPLYDYFCEDEDIKYPTAEDYDRAIDTLIKRNDNIAE